MKLVLVSTILLFASKAFASSEVVRFFLVPKGLEALYGSPMPAVDP
jgi:hypothetical protein